MVKKMFLLMATVILVIATVLSLVACGEEKNENALSCTVMLVDVQDNIVFSCKLTTEAKHLSGAIEELAADEANKVSFDLSGGYINAYTYGGTVYGNPANNDYILVFAEVADAGLTDSTWGTITLDNKVYPSCAVGIGEMPVSEGAVYIIAVRHLEL